MEHTMFGGTKVSSWSFRFTATLVVLMLPNFFVGRVLNLSQPAANTALGALGLGAAVAVIVGTIAAIWKK